MAALAAVTARLEASAAARPASRDLPPLARLDTRAVDVVTLGWRGLWDDVATIWTLQTLVDPMLTRDDADEVARVTRAVTRHGPRLESLYMMGCFVLALELLRPDHCEAITLDGLKALPESWRIPVTQGFVAFYRLHDPQMAAMYYGLAASRPDAPPFLARLAANLVERNELQVDELEETLSGLLGAQEGSRFGELMRRPRRDGGQE